MFKPAWMSLIAVAVLAASCASDQIEPSQQDIVPAPAVVTPPPAEPVEPAPAAEPAEATMPPPDQPPAVAKPEQVAGGKYRVSVVSEPTAKETTPWVKRLEASGLRVKTEPVDVAGKTWQRVVVPGLRSGHDARQMVTYLDQVLGIKGAWVIPKTAVAAAPAPAAPPAPPAPAAEPAPAPATPTPAPAAAPAAPAEHPQN